MNRRTFLGVPGLDPGGCGRADPAIHTIIDTHITCSTRRVPGRAVPSANNRRTRSCTCLSLPSRYRKVVEGLGIVGAIEIECSPLLEDNQWVLDVAQADDIMVAPSGT